MAQKFKKVAEVVEVPIHLCDNAPYNPPRRSDPKSAKIMKLMESIDEHGQLVPVHLYWNANKIRLLISEGHGRIAARKELGHGVVNAIIHNYAPPPSVAASYGEINEMVNKHNGAEKLFTFLHEPMSVGWWHRERFEKMIEAVGKDTAKKMVLKNKGWAFYMNRCIHVAQWAGIPKTQYKAFVHWMLDVDGAETESRKLYESTNGSFKVVQAFKAGIAPCCSIRVAA